MEALTISQEQRAQMIADSEAFPTSPTHHPPQQTVQIKIKMDLQKMKNWLVEELKYTTCNHL